MYPHQIRLTRGFTLIELMIVIAIIGIIAAVAIPAIKGERPGAEEFSGSGQQGYVTTTTPPDPQTILPAQQCIEGKLYAIIGGKASKVVTSEGYEVSC